jgi:O-antigen biosynthesis protein WbqP
LVKASEKIQIKKHLNQINALPFIKQLKQIKEIPFRKYLKKINALPIRKHLKRIKEMPFRKQLIRIKEMQYKKHLQFLKNIKFTNKLYYKEHIKENLSIMIATFSIMLLWPLMTFIGVAIKVSDGGSILFCQERLGKNLKAFKIYKFRTMVYNPTPNKVQELLSEEDERITRVGRILRKTSLDELPQLFNILKGDMCFIGPRPIMKDEYIPHTNSPEANMRFKVNPGLFCSVDIKYRAAATRTKQFDMDAEYVNNITFLKDLSIFFRVIKTVLSRKNVYSIPLKEGQNMYYTPSSDEKGDIKS